MTPRGHEYYEYVCFYVDDIMVISHVPHEFMSKFEQLFALKDGYGHPKTYLGTEIFSFDMADSKNRNYKAFGLGSGTYLRNIIDELEKKVLSVYGFGLPTTATAPMRTGYRPESDISRLLDDEHIGWYQGLIGTLRWLIEVGRIDITHSVTLLSSFLVAPREGHLFEVFHVFGYLKQRMNFCLILDPQSIPFQKYSSCFTHDWVDFYPGAKEAIPPNAPSPRGYAVSTTFYVDADHAGDTVNRRSHTGILGYVQGAPVLWYSKRQATIETSTHGAELVATRIAVEFIESLRYKLYMFGIPLDGPTILLCDNQSVVHNGTRPDSVLKKKHNSISFHKIREAVAAGYVEIHKIATEDNLADLLTKVLSGVATTNLVSHILVKQ